MMIDVFFLLLGLIVLVFGGDFLVKGAVDIALKFRISPLIIGLTIVAFGTSAPELLVSVNAAIKGSPGIAVGNVIGSNIANIAFVLGATAFIYPVTVDKQIKRVDYPFMLLATAMFWLFSFNGIISTVEALILTLLLVLYTLVLIRIVTKGRAGKKDEDVVSVSMWKASGFLLLGFVGLYFGSEWLLSGAVGLARVAGMEEHVIGVTIVAVGTSIPELITSCVAAFKKESGISLGNLVGSNIMNVFCVMGITGLIKPVDVDSSLLQFDVFWFVATAIVIFPLIYLFLNIRRIHGAILLLIYFAYIFLVVKSI
ncbi:MAG: calcium/sodium antiporter [Flavobacteriales bacterium]